MQRKYDIVARGGWLQKITAGIKGTDLNASFFVLNDTSANDGKGEVHDVEPFAFFDRLPVCVLQPLCPSPFDSMLPAHAR